jgi:hypothetical protein
MNEGAAKVKDGNFRTQELTLSAYLVHCGFNYVELEQKLDKAVWVFQRTPALTDAVRSFHERTATVEPRAYHADIASVRKALYQWLQERGLMEQRRVPNGS